MDAGLSCWWALRLWSARGYTPQGPQWACNQARDGKEFQPIFSQPRPLGVCPRGHLCSQPAWGSALSRALPALPVSPLRTSWGLEDAGLKGRLELKGSHCSPALPCLGCVSLGRRFTLSGAPFHFCGGNEEIDRHSGGRTATPKEPQGKSAANGCRGSGPEAGSACGGHETLGVA